MDFSGGFNDMEIYIVQCIQFIKKIWSILGIKSIFFKFKILKEEIKSVGRGI